MIATNIQQSRHLLELGLDPKTADMVWVRYAAGGYRLEVLHRELFERIMETDIAAWSLTALLEVMPKEHEPEIQKSPVTGQYFVYGFFDMDKPTYMTKDYDSPIDAAYEMVCWLLEQGLIKKGDEYDNNNQ